MDDWRRSAPNRLLSSLRFGVTLVALVVVYASVLSALPQVRGVLEMTEMQAFSHWSFFGLIVLLCVSVTVATITRIRFNLINAGVLTVHAGLLLLCISSIWYFGTKVEGDILLRSPRIELLSVADSGPSRVIASLLPEAGQNWSNVMPALGGRVAIDVASTDPPGGVSPDRATLNVRIGDGPTTQVSVSVSAAGPQAISPRLAVRLMDFGAARTFYDQERPALYGRRIGDERWHSAEIHGLPHFRERYSDEGYTLRDTDGHAVASKRKRPAIPLGPIGIPTGWFERWRLPIDLAIEGLPLNVQVTGFVPYVAEMRDTLVPGGDKLDPALTLKLAIPGTTSALERPMFANDPAGSLLDIQTPFEFRWAQSAAQIDEWLQPLAGPDELLIQIADPPVTRRVAIQAGEPITIDGTDCVLKVQQVFPAWPLMSPGFENAHSPAALVEVVRGEKRFTRTVIQRFPQLSQDIDDQGIRRRDGLLDTNITLGYRTSADGWVLIAADAQSAAGGTCTLGIFDSNGRVERQTLQVGQPRRINVLSTPLDVNVAQLVERGRRIEIPVIEPLERRRANVAARSASAIRLRFTAADGWSESRWVSFSQYPDVDPTTIRVKPPGWEDAWEFAYSRVAHDLGAALTPGRLSVKFFPGRQSVESWQSNFLAQHDDWDRPVAASVYTNQTWSIGPWTLFQSGAAQDHWSYTILGVGNRRGIWPMVLGCVMITLGCLYAFYVKPVLRRRIVARALSEKRDRMGSGGTREEAVRTEPVESVA